MNKTLKTILISAAVLFVAAVLVMSGFFISRMVNPAGRNGYNRRDGQQNGNSGWQSMPGSAMRNAPFFGRGMMGGGMMNGFNNGSGNQNFRMGRGMLGWNSANPPANAQPLSLATAKSAVEKYLTSLGNNDVELKEVMVFDQNAYGVVVEKSTGMGAMELLVDPSTQTVFPEYGPERMWNTKYGMMGGGRFAGGCACGTGFNSSSATSSTSLTLDEAAKAAEEYLSANVKSAQLNTDGQPFYGYYTFDYQVDGKIAGMLSVNSASGQVWPHTWHGTFIEEWEASEG